MEVSGTANEPQVAFHSTPPLSQEEIVLMLTAGELPRREVAFTAGEKAGRLALFFGKDLLTRFGADEDKTERLSIRSGESVSEEGNLTYSLEYRLSDRWSVFGEYDRFNAVNAGLKFRIYSK